MRAASARRSARPRRAPCWPCAQTLWRKAFPGCALRLPKLWLAMLNRGVHPVIPSQGSVGASGDLGSAGASCTGSDRRGRSGLQGTRRCPAARPCAAPGSRRSFWKRKKGWRCSTGRRPCSRFWRSPCAKRKLPPAPPMSPPHFRSTRFAAVLRRLMPASPEVRPYPGHAITARNLERLSQGSEIRESHRSAKVDPRVQDPYSLRCAPQVHGAVRDALAQVRATVTIEINSATDNPLVFADSNEVISGGNFHGQPLAMAADQLAVALATLGGISETPHRANDQSPNQPASGFSGARGGPQLRLHDLAGDGSRARQRDENAGRAALGRFDSHVRESGRLRVDGDGRLRAASKPMLANLRNILAIELLAACQGIDLLAPLRTGPATRRAYGNCQVVVKDGRCGSLTVAGYRGGCAGHCERCVQRFARLRENKHGGVIRRACCRTAGSRLKTCSNADPQILHVVRDNPHKTLLAVM